MTAQLRLDIEAGAEFSACRTWRYSLWRRWGAGPAMLWVLLNPSTADEHVNDPTVERCQRRAESGGYGAVWVANIFALRSTDPAKLYRHDDPVGPDNDRHIIALADEADLVVCGWGAHGALQDRGSHVLRLLHDRNTEPHCLRMTGAGQPGHPLYIGYDVEPKPIT